MANQCTQLLDVTERFLQRLKEKAPLFYGEVERTLASDRESFYELAEPLLSWTACVLGDGYEEILIDGYCSFVIDCNKSQMRYERDRCYRNKSYEDVYEQVYDSSDFMSQYHWGVYVTTFVWGHHLKIYRFFRDEFLARLEAHAEGELLDLGSGSGVWHMLALQRLPNWKTTAVDISRTSIELSESMAKGAGLGHAITHHCADAIRFRTNRTMDASISCFLLEHLERPQDLLANLAGQLGDRRYAFVTCALTAAETDHIYEFVRESEPVLLAEEAGFRVVSTLSSSPPNNSEKSYFLPRSLAMVLQKRAGDVW